MTTTPNPTAGMATEAIVAKAMRESWSDDLEYTDVPEAITAALRAHGLLSEGAPSDDAVRDAVDHVRGAVEFQDAISPEAVRVLTDAVILSRPLIQDPAVTALVAEAREWAKYDSTGASKIVIELCAALTAAGVAPQEVIDDAADEQDDLRLHMLATQPVIDEAARCNNTIAPVNNGGKWGACDRIDGHYPPCEEFQVDAAALAEVIFNAVEKWADMYPTPQVSEMIARAVAAWLKDGARTHADNATQETRCERCGHGLNDHHPDCEPCPNCKLDASRCRGCAPQKPTREERIALGWAIVGALKQCGISVTYAISGPAEMFDVAGIILREYPALRRRLDPEKVAEVIEQMRDRARKERDVTKESLGQFISRALCEAYTEGKLTK